MDGSKPALLVAGNLVFDILAGPIDQLVWDGTLWPEHFTEGLGGNGAATSYAAALQGAEVHLVTAAGDDAYGQACRARLNEAGVHAHFLPPASGQTPLTVGLFRPGGARALIHRPGVMSQAFEGLNSLAPFAPTNTAHLHIANPFGVPALRRRSPDYLFEARGLGWSTSLDTGWDKAGEWMGVVGPCLPLLDYLFSNEPESRALTGFEDPAAAANALLAAGARCVIIKLGSRGALSATPGSSAAIHPAFAVSAVDSTGAGDCFCGGFLAALLRGDSLADALRWANACGALSVSQPGSTAGLLDRAATGRWMAAQSPAPGR